MKSYFAKLADRATLANVPATSAVSAAKLTDPFDEPPLVEPRIPTSLDKRTHSSEESSKFAVKAPSAASTSYNTRSLAETQEQAITETPAPTTLLPNRQPSESATERITHDGVREDSSGEPRVVRVEPTRKEATPATIAEPISLPLPPPPFAPRIPANSDEAMRSSVNEIAPAEGRLANLEQEHAILLHKADVFMDHIMERHKPRVTEEGRTEKESFDRKAQLQPPASTSLQPIQPLTRQPDQDTERPSLVIGKLTVEVLPPSPVTVAPQSQVVVIRGGRNRSNGLPSGRRYGLSQF